MYSCEQKDVCVSLRYERYIDFPYVIYGTYVSLKLDVCGAQGIYILSSFAYLVWQLLLEGAKSNKTNRWHMPGHVISSKKSQSSSWLFTKRTASEISNFASLCE